MNGIDLDAVHKRQANDVTVALFEIALGPAADRAAAEELATFRRVKAEALDELAPITYRQREVLAMTAKGLDKAGVGAALNLSRHTVNDYHKQICAALGMTLTEAVVLAAKAGWA